MAGVGFSLSLELVEVCVVGLEQALASGGGGLLQAQPERKEKVETGVEGCGKRWRRYV